MDEIELLNRYKKAFVNFTKVFLGFAIFDTILTLLTNNSWEYKLAIIYLNLIVGVGFPLLLTVFYFIIKYF